MAHATRLRAIYLSISLALLSLSSVCTQQAHAADSITIRDYSFAAIAYSPSQRKVSYAFDFDSREEAEAAAKECGTDDARILTWVSQGFCAIALGDDSESWGYGFNFNEGANTADAVRDALAMCNKHTKNARVVMVLSSDGQYKRDYRSFDLGLYQSKKGETDKAIASFTAAIRQNPSHLASYLSRAECYMAKKDYPGSIADYTQCITLDSENGSLYFNRGLMHRLNGDFPRALEDFSQSIRKQPENPQCYHSRGITYFLQKNYSAAVADFSKSLSLNPKDAESHYRLGIIYYAVPDKSMHDFKKAIAHTQSACELTDWQEPQYIQLLAAVQADTGNLDEAIRLQKMVVALPSLSTEQLASAKKDLETMLRQKQSSVTPKPEVRNESSPGRNENELRNLLK